MIGWTPHDGGGCPVAPDTIVHLLLRGTPERGPRESGPSPAKAVNWLHAVVTPGPSDPIAQLLGRASPDPAGNIIGWRLFDTPGYFERHPHVRADLGAGR